MTSVDKVKSICKERKIPISRLEKELGYANGYIGQLRKGTFPDDRLLEIAKYLSVSTAYLLGEETENAPTQMDGRELPHAEQREILAGNGIRLMLDADAKLTEDQLEDIVNFIEFQQRKYNR